MVKCLIFRGFVEVCIEVVALDDLRLNTSEMLILQGVCGLKRYAVPGFRLLALKCKLSPIITRKHTIIVQYIVDCQVKLRYTCFRHVSGHSG